MRHLLILVPLALSATLAVAQPAEVHPSATSITYSKYRKQSTDPIYSLSKIKALIKKIKRDQDDNMVMPDKTFAALTPKEKFSYTVLHGEDFSQNCSEMPQFEDEHKKLFAYFPSPFGDEAVWSDRQRAFLDKNHALVVKCLRETIAVRKRIGVNLKQTIVYAKATELVPTVIALYKKDHKDHDILTLLMQIMVDAKYKPFEETAFFKTLYSEDASYQAFVPFNSANEAKILDLAQRYVKSLK